MKTKRRSIKWKIFQYLMGFCILLLTILWLFQTVFLDSFYKQIKQNEIELLARSLASSFTTSDLAGLSKAIDLHGDIQVEVWSTETGLLIFSQEGRTGGPPMPQSGGDELALSQLRDQSALWKEVQEQGGFVTKRFFNSQDDAEQRRKESIVCATLTTGGDGSKAMLMVSAIISPVNATVETLRIQLIYISAIMLLLAVGLAVLISQRVSAPIEALNASARELGAGHYETTFAGAGYQEIAELAETLGHAAQELGKTDRLRRELIANVSHDLRTPLTLITGYGEMIRDLPNENTPENMQVIIDETKRLTSLVSNLLDLSRLQSGTLEMRYESFDLTEEVHLIIARFMKFCKQEGYSIRFENQENVRVHADSERIAQVVYNYINNALTHTGEDKCVMVRQTLQGERVKIEVIDTGEGIAPQDKAQIWERYYKVDKVHKRAKEGNGLGLSIVKSILTQHPGVEFGVESELGNGSVFWFSLPVL